MDLKSYLTATAEKLKSELGGLPADDRAKLTHFLFQSFRHSLLIY
jgi:hypothetical protein